MPEPKLRRNAYILIAVIFCLCIAAVVLCLSTGVFLKKDTADPLFSKGTISIKQPGDDEWIPLTDTMDITEGCEIMTGEGSSLELSLPGENIIKIGENSHIRFNTLGSIEVTKIARSDIDLLYGKMRAFVAPFRDNRSRFSIRTGLSSIGVRGTDFGVITSRDDATTEILCLDGEVLVSTEDDTAEWEPVIITANKEVILAADVPISGPTLLDEGKRQAFLADMAFKSLEETDSHGDETPVESIPETDTVLHEVQTGDTLWDLAEYYYDNPRDYPIIFDANRDIIDDEYLIYPVSYTHLTLPTN